MSPRKKISPEPALEAAPLLTMNYEQFGVLAQELSAIEKHAVRGAILAADDTARLLPAIHKCLETGQVPKEMFIGLRDKLQTQNDSVLLAILAGNLLSRLDGDLAPRRS